MYATVLRDLARRVKAMQTEAVAHEKAILAVIKSWGPDLLDQQGVGPIVAATVLCAWPHAGRFRHEAAFASLAGVAPIPASSGLTTRHRLNRCGDRQLNRALHVVVLSRLRYDPATRAYAHRRRVEGKTDREIKRCLKRYIARQMIRLLEKPAAHPLTSIGASPRSFAVALSEHDELAENGDDDRSHADDDSCAIRGSPAPVWVMQQSERPVCTGRLVWRMLLDRWTRAKGEHRQPVIVMGAGDGGLQIITAMLKAGPYEPVAVLDDDPRLRNLRLKGVRVAGDRTKLEEVVERTGAVALVIAIPSASGEVIRDMAGRADQLGLTTLILPPVGDLLGGAVGIADIRPLTEADLLGRRELSLDIDSVAGYLTGKRVLVTGAGGSIGSELCRQVHRFAPASLVMLDRDESALQAVQLSIEGNGLLDSRDLVVACIRDLDRMAEVFDEHRPEVVFHAAALKHLPLLEMHPDEGWKTNVIGTQNLLELSGKFDVERFVNISTDKAADASSVLGRTKRIAEQLTSFAGKTQDGTYLSVRFGNVLGSRGSVLPLFRKQIEQGGPVTVTHPEVTRFFMTIPEACELVIQAGALASHDGKVLVLDMGEPVRISDLARRLINESGKRVEIQYTGLRPGEKLHEVLFSPDEHPRVSEHPLIQWVDVPAMSPGLVAEAERPDLRDPIDLRLLRAMALD